MEYLLAMGIGSLSKYRRYFMIGGFVIFAGGGIMRWHHQRQLDSLQGSTNPLGPARQVSWQEDCASYACRAIGVRRAECRNMCSDATEFGSPNIPAERIANACKKQCVADETPTLVCKSECFVREATNLMR